MFVGIVAGAAGGLAILLWNLLVNPERVLMLFDAVPNDWFDEDRGLIRALIWMTALALFMCAVLTGLVMVFVASTSG